MSHIPIAQDNRWAVILADGEGTRLLDLTRLVSGDARPKQFCALFGEHSLLAQTCQRAQRQQLRSGYSSSVGVAAHRSLLPAAEPGNFAHRSQRIVQPANKGTAPAIVHSLLSIERHDRNALVAVLPGDHHYSDDQAFTATLELAFDTAARHRDSVVLLGSPARAAHTDYGWIEPGPPLIDGGDSFEVRGFCEKPPADLAIELFEQGATVMDHVIDGGTGRGLSGYDWRGANRASQSISAGSVMVGRRSTPSGMAVRSLLRY